MILLVCSFHSQLYFFIKIQFIVHDVFLLTELFKKKKNHTNFKISYIVGKWLNSKNFFLLKNIEKSYVSNSYISF